MILMSHKRHPPVFGLRGNRSGPLFILPDGRGLTWHLFKEELENLLSALNMFKRKYNTHRFHIEAATSYKQENVPDTYIHTYAGLLEK